MPRRAEEEVVVEAMAVVAPVALAELESVAEAEAAAL